MRKTVLKGCGLRKIANHRFKGKEVSVLIKWNPHVLKILWCTSVPQLSQQILSAAEIFAAVINLTAESAASTKPPRVLMFPKKRQSASLQFLIQLEMLLHSFCPFLCLSHLSSLSLPRPLLPFPTFILSFLLHLLPPSFPWSLLFFFSLSFFLSLSYCLSLLETEPVFFKILCKPHYVRHMKQELLQLRQEEELGASPMDLFLS